MRFFHEGQLEGRRVRVPMQVSRRPVESPDADIQAFYRRFLQAMQRPDQSLNIIVNGDEAVPMQRLVDVMDALKDSGFDSISIAAKKKN